jgi:hypothetical protein
MTDPIQNLFTLLGIVSDPDVVEYFTNQYITVPSVTET